MADGTVGRPSKMTSEALGKVARALRAGNTQEASALYAGVSPSTLAGWARRFPEVKAMIVEAESSAEVGFVAVIAQAAQRGDWRAAAFWLERKRHRDWGRRDRLEVVQAVRDLARQAGLDADEEEEAVREAERMIRNGIGIRRDGTPQNE